MGDRANVELVISEEYPPLYLYTHWQGATWNQRLASALEVAEERWDDPDYCARIIVTEMFSDLIGVETGGGIGFTQHGDEYPLIEVNIDYQKVHSYRADGGLPVVETFEQYVDREHPEREYGEADLP